MTDAELMELRAELDVWKAEVLALGVRLGRKTAEANLSKGLLERETRARKHHEEQRRKVLSSLRATEIMLDGIRGARDLAQSERDTAVERQEDTYRELLASESQATAFQEERDAALTREASSHSLNKILGELRQAEECADRLRTQRDRAVDQYEDTHRDLLIVESQVTAYRTRVDEGEAKYATLSKQWSSLLSQKNYAERQVGRLRADLVKVQDLAKDRDFLQRDRDHWLNIVLESQEEPANALPKPGTQRAKAERDAALGDVCRLEAEVSRVEGNYNTILHEVGWLRRQMIPMQKDLDQALSENDELRGKNKTFEEERDAALRDCETFRFIRQKVEDEFLNNTEDMIALQEELKRLKSEAVSNQSHISFHMGRAEGSSQCVQQLEPLRAERNSLLDEKERLGRWLRDARRRDDRKCIELSGLQEVGEQLAADLATAQAQVRVLKHRIGRLTTGETIAALGIRDLAHKEQIVALEVEHNRIELVCIGLQRDVDSAKIILGQRYSRIVSLREKLRQTRAARDDADSNAAELRRGKQGWVDRILSLTEEIVVAEQQLKTVTEAYHALHLKTEAITTFVPAVPMHTGGQSRFPGGPLRCVYCRKEFTTFQDAKDKEQHEMDCHWVELEEVALWTEQDVLRVAAGETG